MNDDSKNSENPYAPPLTSEGDMVTSLDDIIVYAGKHRQSLFCGFIYHLNEQGPQFVLPTLMRFAAEIEGKTYDIEIPDDQKAVEKQALTSALKDYPKPSMNRRFLLNISAASMASMAIHTMWAPLPPTATSALPKEIQKPLTDVAVYGLATIELTLTLFLMRLANKIRNKAEKISLSEQTIAGDQSIPVSVFQAFAERCDKKLTRYTTALAKDYGSNSPIR